MSSVRGWGDWLDRTIIDRRVIGQRGAWNICDQLAPPPRAPAWVAGYLADSHRVEVPFFKNRLELRLATAPRDYQHPLLRLREQNFVGTEVLLAERHPVELEIDAEPAARGHLAGRRCQPGRAHVLDRN